MAIRIPRPLESRISKLASPVPSNLESRLSKLRIPRLCTPCRGVRRSNIFFAVVMMLIACAYLPQNIRNFNLLYLIEGLLDMLGAVMLAFHPDIRRHCKCS